MNRIILASHGGLSAGMKDTVQMILGELPNLYALATLRDETEPITVAARRLLDGFAAEDAVYIVTDVMGGSVNNEMLTLLPEYPAVHLICGMNASLVLTLASNDEALTQDELAECIADAKAQIIDCNLLLKKAAQDEEDDLFSWTGHVGAQRIIVVDDDAANDEMKKSALLLSKPAGVRVNIFTVDKAIAKMPKVEQLDEKIMMIFGNTAALLKFCQAYPKIKEINYGAVANKPGSKAFDQSVFLTPEEQEDTQKLLDMGIKIYSQQTPTFKVVPIDHT